MTVLLNERGGREGERVGEREGRREGGREVERELLVCDNTDTCVHLYSSV